MKRIYTILVAVLLTATAFAQASEKISYQAVIRDASDNLIINTQVGMQISIMQGSASGTLVYEEIQTPTTNSNGLLSIEIGGQTGFDTISWANGPYFIKTETDPTGGTSYTITGTSQLLSVPYALHAKTAEIVTGGITETDPIYNLSIASGITGNDTINWNNKLDAEVDGSVTNEIQNLSSVLAQDNSADNDNITNLADPINDQDAATKAYVDLLVSRINTLEGQVALSQGFTDIDGNHYDAVLIGNQIWMANDLKVKHYPNGDTIPLVTDNTTWGNLDDNNTDDAMCYYNNNASNEADTYGALYTYAAAIADDWTRDLTTNQGVCPDGWHLPTSAEWDTLNTYLNSDAGSKLAGNASLWTDGVLEQNSNFGETGFFALPSGTRDNNTAGTFGGLGVFGLWWSANESGTNADYNYINYYNTTLNLGENEYKSYGFSVRCIKD